MAERRQLTCCPQGAQHVQWVEDAHLNLRRSAPAPKPGWRLNSARGVAVTPKFCPFCGVPLPGSRERASSPMSVRELDVHLEWVDSLGKDHNYDFSLVDGEDGVEDLYIQFEMIKPTMVIDNDVEKQFRPRAVHQIVQAGGYYKGDGP